MEYTTIGSDLQEPKAGDCDALIDRQTSGKERNWRGRKMANELLALAYESVNPDKAARLRACGSQLTFRVYEDGRKRLDSMVSCRVRLCPICAWRRSIKVFTNTMRCLDYINDQRDKAYIFLTLTVRNCYASDLTATIDAIYEGLNRFCGYKEFKAAFCGWFRGFEVTHNVDYESKDFDTYHPHIHILLHTKAAYWGRAYLKQERIAELWRKAMRLDYDPICDVRRTYGKDVAAIAEVSKYSAKSKDYILPEDWDLTVDAVRTLDAALNNRRLVAYAGTLRAAYKALKLEDEDSGDLVNVGTETAEEDKPYFLKTYFWHTGYRQYYGDKDIIS